MTPGQAGMACYAGVCGPGRAGCHRSYVAPPFPRRSHTVGASIETQRMTSPQDLPTYYTTAEVALVLRESRENVSRRCKRGELAARRVGRRYLISRESLEAFMAPPVDSMQVAIEHARELDLPWVEAELDRRGLGSEFKIRRTPSGRPSQDAVVRANEILAALEAVAERMTPREQAEAASSLNGRSVDELEARIRRRRGLPPMSGEGVIDE